MSERTSVLLRISKELKEKLRKLADAEHRSVNQQIEFLLQKAMEQHDKPRKASDR